MTGLNQVRVSCPYCGERIEVLVDEQEVGQQYIEDCQVCCRPITFSIGTGIEGEAVVSVYDENEVF